MRLESLDKLFTRAGIDVQYANLLLTVSRTYGKTTESIEEAKKHLKQIAERDSEEVVVQRINQCNIM